MPLDITPTPAQTRAETATSTAIGTATPGLAALFGLLLAQTVSQGAPTVANAAMKPAPLSAATQPLVTSKNIVSAASSNVPVTIPSPIAPATVTSPAPTAATEVIAVKSKDTSKEKKQDAPTPLLLPIGTIVLVPTESSAPVNPQKAMDTAPTSSSRSELPISVPTPTPTSAPETSVIIPTEQALLVPLGENVIVPTEVSSTSAPASASSSETPKTPTVPMVTAQKAEEVSLASLPQASTKTGSLQKTRAVADNQSVGETRTNTSLGNGTAPTAAASIPVPVVPVSDKDTIKNSDEQPSPKASAEGAAVTTTASATSASAAATSPVPTLAVTVPPATAHVTITAPMPPADRTQMLQQVSDGLQTVAVHAAGNGQQQMTLQLHPKDWGQVNVSVTMTPTTQADGRTTTQVVAHIIADQPSVKAALETHQEDLRQSLKDAGLNLDRMTVTVRPTETGAQAGLGDGRRESRSGEGTPDNAASWTGTTAQGGAAGGNSSAFAAFEQAGSWGQGKQSDTPVLTPGEQSNEPEPVALPAVALMTGRIDTHA